MAQELEKIFEAVDYLDPSKVLERKEENLEEEERIDKKHWKLNDFFQKNHKRYETVKLKCQNKGITVQQISGILGVERHTVARYLNEFREIMREVRK